jgi:ACS family hexuronate transporter-like MFS transporter
VIPEIGRRAALLKWRVCLLLFLATTLNYLDRQTMSILAPILQKEMHLDNEALGWLFAVFYYAYTFSLFAVGPLLDRSHLRWAFGAAVLLWSTVSAMTGLAAGFAGLMVFRLLLGVTEAANWPAALRIVARALEPCERALGNGIFTSGTSVGALIAPFLILALTAAAGWRWAFFVLGSLGVLWLATWLLWTRHPQLDPVWREPDAGRRANSGPLRRGLAEVVRNPRFVPVLIVSVLINPYLYFSVNWLPTYFAQQRGLAPGGRLGWVLTGIYLGLDLGSILCGAAVLALTRRGRTLERARRIVFLWATVPLAACAAVPLLPGLGAAVVVLIAVNVGLGAWTAMYLTMAQDVSHTYVSTTLGLLSGSGALAGALAMWAVGKVTQATGSFSIPMLAFSLAGLISAAAGCAASRTPVAAKRPVFQPSSEEA